MAFQFDSKPLQQFVELPFEIYKRDPQWIPPIRSAVNSRLSKQNPWFDRGEACHFLIPDSGRVSAFHTAGDPVGHVGMFECIDHYPTAERLLDAAVGWLRAKGAATIRGPVEFDTWHSYRFVVAGGDRHPPFLLEPYNPPHYPAFWERYGFDPSAHYSSNLHEDLPALVGSLERHYRKASGAGVRFRPLSLARFDAELRLLYDLSAEIFRDNWGYRPIGYGEFARLYAGSRRLLDPGLVTIAEDAGGRPLGFLFGLPDHGVAVRAMRGRGGPVGALRFLAARRRPAGGLLKTMGVVPAARGSNVAFALCYPHYRHMLESGYRYGIHALMLASNASRRMSAAKGGRPIREYAVYDLR